MCGVAAFIRSGTYHERAIPWQLAQEGLAQLAALKLRRQMACSRWGRGALGAVASKTSKCKPLLP